MATVNLGNIKFNWKGTYNAGTAYAIDDVVSYNGSSYVCIQATTGNLPTVTAYWDTMSQKGTDADLLNIASTAQGDIYYNNGSAIARLAPGTANQVLQTGGTSANPSWTTVSGDLSNSGATQNVWKVNFSTGFNTSSTTGVDTGLELSGMPTLSADTDFIVHFTEARREQSWNQTTGVHQMSTDNGSNWNTIGYTGDSYETSPFPQSNEYDMKHAVYYLSFTSGQTPRFKVQGHRYGSSNNYYINSSHNKSSIIAIKVTQ